MHASPAAGASPREIIFTSGATEANNMAMKGAAHFYREKKRHVITTQTEHKCVLDSCRVLQQQGWDVTYLPVDAEGLVSVDAFRAAIRPDTVLASVMFVNNEIGVIQPMAELGAICREHKARRRRIIASRAAEAAACWLLWGHPSECVGLMVPRFVGAAARCRGARLAYICQVPHTRPARAQVFFHTDAAQAVGKVPVDVNALNVDLMSISGHKVYGPKGVGALYVRRRPRVRLEPQMNGGGQERGLRSGTVPTALAVGFGEACALAQQVRPPPPRPAPPPPPPPPQA